MQGSWSNIPFRHEADLATYFSALRLGSPTRRRRRRGTAEDAEAIDLLQDRLYAEGRRALLVVLQGTDTSGKDGTMRRVFNRTGPLGVSVHAFRRPSEEELAHDYLWRWPLSVVFPVGYRHGARTRLKLVRKPGGLT